MGQDMPRVWHQSVTALETLDSYAQRMPALVAPGTRVVLHGLPAQTYAGKPPAEILRYPYLRHRIHALTLEMVRRAEPEGYDAVALVTFGEPLLEQTRSILARTGGFDAGVLPAYRLHSWPTHDPCAPGRRQCRAAS
ncbi:hypothetical protein CAF53_16740 [Sphingobium sp. LB126]|nr:hypothetical protein CAF53_16740 [Sphingobium sp. LB126]